MKEGPGTLSKLTSADAVNKALAECDALGRNAFLRKYGFHRSRLYSLLHEGRPYDSKAIAAAAYGYQYPKSGPLRSEVFSGGEKTVKSKLEALGFNVIKLDASSRLRSADPDRADVRPGEVLTNRQLMDTYRVSNSGGMRRSLKANTLILVSDFTKSLYLDEWRVDVLHYCGMGQKGDQSLQRSQNRTLAESRTNGVTVHLFEVYKKNQYTYIGRLELSAEPYPSTQDDVDGKPRRVWVFPLRLSAGHAPSVPAESLRRVEQRQRRQARRLTDDEVANRARGRGGKAGTRSATTTVYVRDAFVAEGARRRAHGICDLCGAAAPFMAKDGEPYLEVHHIVWLAHGGSDTLANTVALCPNCHRRMHQLDNPKDRGRLLARAKAR